MKKLLGIIILTLLTSCSSYVVIETDFSPQAKGYFDSDNYGKILVAFTDDNLNKTKTSLIYNTINRYFSYELFNISRLPDNVKVNKNSITDYAKKNRFNAVLLIKKAVFTSNNKLSLISINIYDPYGGVLIDARYRDTKSSHKYSRVIYDLFNEIFFENQEAIDLREKEDNSFKKKLLKP